MYEKHFTVKKKFEKLKEAINKVHLHILLKHFARDCDLEVAANDEVNEDAVKMIKIMMNIRKTMRMETLLQMHLKLLYRSLRD